MKRENIKQAAKVHDAIESTEVSLSYIKSCGEREKRDGSIQIYVYDTDGGHRSIYPSDEFVPYILMHLKIVYEEKLKTLLAEFETL